jgi:hypothetical protein
MEMVPVRPTNLMPEKEGDWLIRGLVFVTFSIQYVCLVTAFFAFHCMPSIVLASYILPSLYTWLLGTVCHFLGWIRTCQPPGKFDVFTIS